MFVCDVCMCARTLVCPRSVCINGDLAIAVEANAKLCMSNLMVNVQVGLRVPTSSSLRHVQPSSGHQSHHHEDLPCQSG